jgi:hypothetical protein
MYNAISVEAHAEHYIKLIEDKAQGPWQQTLVNGKGYKNI